jgi:hypothetical protein
MAFWGGGLTRGPIAEGVLHPGNANCPVAGRAMRPSGEHVGKCPIQLD